MSIAATVSDVREGDDPALILGPIGGDGPDRNDKPGQPVLHVVNRPCPPLRGFIGMKVWGGAGQLMIGETQVAERIGYTRIRLKEADGD